MQNDSRQGSPSPFEGQRHSPGDSGSNCAQNMNGFMAQEAEDVSLKIILSLKTQIKFVLVIGEFFY